jgi:hypothetical protein
MNNKFIKSVATAVLGLSLTASCSGAKKSGHDCAANNQCAPKEDSKNKCSSKKDGKNKCSSAKEAKAKDGKNSCSANKCSANKKKK